jgi:hypothetical protein
LPPSATFWYGPTPSAGATAPFDASLGFDNVTFTVTAAAVPEPSSWLLLGLAPIGLLLRRK